MQNIIDQIEQWIKDFLIGCITGNLGNMFDEVNTKVGEIANDVGQTPSGWNGGVFSMIQNISETVIIPIAGMILTFVCCYELIQLIIEKNNLHDVDTWIFFKWVFKTAVAVYLVTNTFTIIMAIFDVALPAAYVTFTGKDGAAHRFPYKEYRENEQRIRRRFGLCRSFAYEPKSKVTLARRLRLEQEGREREARPADLQAHVRQLAADKVQDEAQRIACEFARLWNPNGGDGRFMVKISEIFLNIATKDEVNQLAAALPYKSLTFATRRDGCPGLFAFVGKEENRGEIARRMILGERPEPEARKKPPHKAGPERS